MKVTELKAALLERGLDTKGNKAALVQRLQDAETDNNDARDTSEDMNDNGNNGGEMYDPEEPGDAEEEEFAESVVRANGDHDSDGEDGAGFDNKEFVQSKPQGISFGLHQPTPVKPQPKEAPVQSDGFPIGDSPSGPKDPIIGTHLGQHFGFLPPSSVSRET